MTVKPNIHRALQALNRRAKAGRLAVAYAVATEYGVDRRALDAAYDRACNEAIAQRLEADEWVSVANEYPPEYERVLFFDAREGVCFVGWNSYWHTIGGPSRPGSWVMPSGDTDDMHVTHWKPLPKGPQRLRRQQQGRVPSLRLHRCTGGDGMTEEEVNTLHDLGAAGYAVIVWSPEELRGVDPRRVEARSIELGYEVIECLTDEEEEEEGEGEAS